MSKIEEYKREKDGLDLEKDLPRFAREGWQSISEADRERLKWLGIFYRRRTPGDFTMRVRIPNGITRSAQFLAFAKIAKEFGEGFADLTTRQQVQLRGAAGQPPPPPAKEEVAAPALPMAKPRVPSTLADWPEGKGRCVKLNGLELAVFRHAGRLLALANACPHEGAALAEGELKGDFVVCPGHGYRFNLRTGACSDAPDLRARVYPVVLRDGALMLDEEPESR